jgi:hypothetical protein
VIEAVAAGVTVGTVLVGAGVWGASDRLVRQRRRSTVVATLKSGAAFRGVLFDSDPRSYVLRNAEALGRPGDGVHVLVDGELCIARADVEFLQRP